MTLVHMTSTREYRDAMCASSKLVAYLAVSIRDNVTVQKQDVYRGCGELAVKTVLYAGTKQVYLTSVILGAYIIICF